jgi:enterochelin esterase-like enzyme
MVSVAARPTFAARYALACVVALVSVFAAVAHGAPPVAGSFVDGTLASAAGRLSYEVYLPPGYSNSGRRYPVIYYLHGLPAGPEAYRSFGYVPAAVELTGLQAIIVAPQAATATDTDPEYLNKGVGQDWDTAIATQLPDRIDADFRTIPDRAGRAIVGASAGGYGAMLLGLHHLARFSVIESWSGYFHPTDPTGTKSIASSPWQNAHSFVHSLRRALVVHPTLIAFYVGDADTLFRAENVEYARELSRARVPFRFRIVPGGHQQSLWAAQAPDWLTLALARLEQPH